MTEIIVHHTYFIVHRDYQKENNHSTPYLLYITQRLPKVKNIIVHSTYFIVKTVYQNEKFLIAGSLPFVPVRLVIWIPIGYRRKRERTGTNGKEREHTLPYDRYGRKRERTGTNGNEMGKQTRMRNFSDGNERERTVTNGNKREWNGNFSFPFVSPFSSDTKTGGALRVRPADRLTQTD